MFILQLNKMHNLSIWIDLEKQRTPPGYTAYILLHRPLAVLSTIVHCTIHTCGKLVFIIQKMYRFASYLFAILHIPLQNKEEQMLWAFSHTFHILYFPKF